MKKMFKCPISPYIMWDRGLVYLECPLSIHGRDMPQCADCRFKNKNKTQTKTEKTIKIEKTIKVEKRNNKGPIPKIGKTYNS